MPPVIGIFVGLLSAVEGRRVRAGMVDGAETASFHGHRYAGSHILLESIDP